MKKIDDILNHSTNKKSQQNYRYYQKDSFDFFQLVNKWPDIVGEKLAQMTAPLKIRTGTLYIATGQGIYADHLHFLSEEIKKKIINKFPLLKKHIQRIQYLNSPNLHRMQGNNEELFSLDKTQLGNFSKQLNPHSPEYRQRYSEADKLFSHVTDEEMKESLISLYIQGAGKEK